MNNPKHINGRNASPLSIILELNILLSSLHFYSSIGQHRQCKLFQNFLSHKRYKLSAALPHCLEVKTSESKKFYHFEVPTSFTCKLGNGPKIAIK